MDCEQVREELDAHALGALSHREAAEVERHVAECLACWEELEKSRETAAMLTLAVPMHEAPPRLREKIMSQAQREARRAPVSMGSTERPGLLGRYGWGLATGFASFAAIGAFAFAAFLQVQVEDLEDEKASLETMMESASEEIESQNQILAVLAAADTEKVELEPVVVRGGLSAVATYSWSRSHDRGVITCENVPALTETEKYTVWLTFENSDPVPIADLWPTAERCQAAIDLGTNRGRPKGIGITKEKADDSGNDPNLPWLLYAEFEN